MDDVNKCLHDIYFMHYVLHYSPKDLFFLFSKVCFTFIPTKRILTYIYTYAWKLMELINSLSKNIMNFNINDFFAIQNEKMTKRKI